tara:strand:+ start:44 stop:271 length:228 start_codon:yes stop_codon:yes gene_type:complete
MIKWIQNIVTKGVVVYIITLAVCFKIWDIYVVYNTNDYTYLCQKGKLYKSATPESKNVFIKQIHQVCINGELNER